MAPVRGSRRERLPSMFGYALSRRPTVSGCAVPSGETSESTAQMPVSGAVLDRRTSRLAGPAERTSVLNGAVVYDRPSGSASVMSVATGKALNSALGPDAPTIAVFGGSLLPGDEGSAGKDWSV